MAGLQLLEMPPDVVRRRVMFALEFIDPVTGRVVGDGLVPRVKNLSPPFQAPGGRFVWLDVDPPAQRQIHVDLTIRNPMYAPPSDPIDFTAEANDGSVEPAILLQQWTLTITPRYVPPAGITSAVGMVVENAASKAPLAGIELSLALLHTGNQVFVGARKAVSDAGGAFTAIADGLGDIVPDPAPPTESGDIRAWLAVTRPGAPPVQRFTNFLPLRLGRLTQLRETVRWAELNNNPPQ
jgi:hypothetical protein